MRTADVERLQSFYVGVLGFSVRQEARAGSVWLDADDVVLMIERAADGERAVTPGTMDLLAFTMGDDTKERWRERIERSGTRIEDETAYTLYFRDPDDRRIAVSSYCFA
jgi:catechol-2,3-dioxygenase